MRLPAFDYVAPQSLAEAMAVRSKHRGDSLWLAGGTDLIVRLRQRLTEPALVISLNSLPALDTIANVPEKGLSIGALTTLHSLETSPLIQKDYHIISLAARRIASPQIRNSGTIGGNLCIDTRCWYYNQSHFWRSGIAPCFKTGGAECHVVKHGKRCYALLKADLVPALLALDATVTLASPRKQRTVPLVKLYRADGAKHLTLLPSEMVTGVQVPPVPPDCGTAYIKHTYRSEVDFGICSVGATISLDPQGACREAKLFISGVSSAPVKASGAEASLKGNKLSPELSAKAAALAVKDIGAIVSIGAPPDYKRKIIRYVVSHVIDQAWQQAALKAGG